MNTYKFDARRLDDQYARSGAGGTPAWYRDEGCWNCDPPEQAHAEHPRRRARQERRAPRSYTPRRV